jgi:pimeloyl-ACP methyl ester carboxylesterase
MKCLACGVPCACAPTAGWVLRLARLLALAASLAGCGIDGAPALALQACRLDGVAVAARCGALPVFEDRGARIGIHVAVIPAISASPLPDPIVFLAGGPGQSAISLAAVASTILDAARRNREIVLIDIRGTGRSHPLDCGRSGPGEAPQALPVARTAQQAAHDCLQKFGGAVRHYSTPNAAADVRQVLQALGYQQVNLWGVSYGTRLALEIARQDARLVRSLALDGAVPAALKLPLFLARDGDDALQQTIRDCEAVPACGALAPALRQDIAQLTARLRAAPLTVTRTDPATGVELRTRVDAEVFHNGLRAALYSGEAASLIPLMVREARQGNFAPLLALTSWSAQQVGAPVATGLLLNVVCNEEMPRITAAEVAGATAGTVFGTELHQAMERVCAGWPATALPAGYFAPPPVTAPALIFSGGLDPVTPPRWGAALQRQLPHARHIVAPRVSHNVSAHGCAPRLLADFFQHASAQALDAGCLERLSRPPFFIDFAGPPP